MVKKTVELGVSGYNFAQKVGPAASVLAGTMQTNMPDGLRNTSRAIVDRGFGLVNGTQNATQQIKILNKIGGGIGLASAGVSAFDTGKNIANKQYDQALISGLKASSPLVPGAGAAASIADSGNNLRTAVGNKQYLAAAQYTAEITGKGASAGLGYIYGGPKGADAAVGGVGVLLLASEPLSNTSIFRMAAEYTLRRGW